MIIGILLILSSVFAQAEPDTLLVLSDSMYVSNETILNLGGQNSWYFHPGDDPNWADPDFDHSGWIKLRPVGITDPLPDSLWAEGYGWFRSYFMADSSFYQNPWYLYFYTWGAAEVYFDGKLVQSYGVFSTDPALEKRYNPFGNVHPAFSIAPRDTHLVAVRLSYHPAKRYEKIMGDNSANYGFGIGFVKKDYNDGIIQSSNVSKLVSYLGIGILFIIFLLHGYLFYLFREQKANLLVAIITALLLLHNLSAFNYIHFSFDRLGYYVLSDYSFTTLFIGAVLLLPYTVVSLFNLQRFEKFKYLPWLVVPLFLIHVVFNEAFTFTLPATGLLVLISCIYLLIKARNKGERGVGFVSFGFVGLLLLVFTMIFYQELTEQTNWNTEAIFVTLIYIIIPVSMTLLMAYKMANLYTGLEDIVKERTAALQNSLLELKSAQQQLVQQEKLASLGQLTAGIAHEIKNPLNFVNNFSELSVELIEEAREEIRNSELSSQNSEALAILDDIETNLRKIHEHGSRADSIVKSMLQHSRGGSGKMEPTDLNGLVKEYVNLSFHGMRASKDPINVDIEMELDDSIGEVPLIAEDFSRVIVNLCNNAFDAMREKLNSESRIQNSEEYKPKLTIRTHQQDSGVSIEIEDNGPGIPEEMKDKILQPFFTTKKGTEGTGLGLSITNDIIKAHGGSLDIESKSGEYTIFKVKINKK